VSDEATPGMVKITIDGREMQVPAGDLLIAAAEKAGTYIPRFCWHSRMKPVGLCRMCLVEVEGPRGTMLTTSCTMQVNDGMVVHTESDVVKKAQEGVLEFLLINHPLDCPVCDKGGECPLQDQTVSFGPGESRFVEEKRHFEKPIPISDLVLLDRERCILCARCTRFSEEISGDPLIEFVERGSGTQVLTFPDEPFASYFSGNTVQICPVGALTATAYRFRARPWDLQAAESTCPHCSVGCRISVQSSQNQVLRFQGVDVDSTNQGWLCDKGRFGFEYLNSPDRLSTPKMAGDDGLQEASWIDALDAAASGLMSIIDEHGPGAVAGIGGARGTNEEAYAFGKFLRSVVGTGHLDAQIGDGLEPRLLAAPADRGLIGDLEKASSILVWGPDLKEELPVLYLRVRRAATELGAKLVVAHPRRTGLDDVATHTLRYRPGAGQDLLRRLAAGEGDAGAALAALKEGPTVVITGLAGLTEGPDLAEAVAAFGRDLPDATVLPVARRSNVFGALDMGVSPALLPGRASAVDDGARATLSGHWGADVPDGSGRDTAGIIEGLEAGAIRAVVLLGADPAVDFPDPARASAALAGAELIVAIDMFESVSTSMATVVFPALGFTETEGTVTNLEGRVQKVSRLLPGPGGARPSWEILEDVATRMGGSIGATSAGVIATEIEKVAPAYAGATWDALNTAFGRDGIVVPTADATQPIEYVPVDRPSAPVQRDLVLHLARVLYDGGTTVQRGLSLAKLAAEPAVYITPQDAHRLGVADGSAVRLSGGNGSAELTARFDDSLTPGAVYLPFNLGISVGSGLEVELEALA